MKGARASESPLEEMLTNLEHCSVLYISREQIFTVLELLERKTLLSFLVLWLV